MKLPIGSVIVMNHVSYMNRENISFMEVLKEILINKIIIKEKT